MMTANKKTVRIFMMPQQFPCGPQSSCCSPIGQTEEDVNALKNTIEKTFGFPTEIKDVTKGSDMREHLKILRLIRSFGHPALPLIALDEEVISMGSPTPEQAVQAIRFKLNNQ